MNSTTIKNSNSLTCAVLAAGLAVLPPIAQGQNAMPDAAEPGSKAVETALQANGKSDEVQTVVVTAQYRAERLQDIPISISALSSDELAQRGVTDLSSLGGLVPGLFISGSNGANGTNLISIRGISGQAQPIGAPQAAAVYLDGVYLSRPDAAFFGLDDVERIEVLRGPQGTLYGRNSTAGAINIVTIDPSETLRGSIDINAGSYRSRNVKGSLSGPLGEGWSAGVSGSYSGVDNYFVNGATGTRLDNGTSTTLRGKLRYKSSDGAFDANFSADTTERDSQPSYKNIYSGFPSGVYVGVHDPYIVQMDPVSRSLVTTRVDSSGAGLVLNFKVNDHLHITSISSSRKFSNFSLSDLDGTTVPGILSSADNHSKTKSSELRALFDYDRFKATVGINWYDEKSSLSVGSGSPTAKLNNAPGTRDAPRVTSDLVATAAFGQIEYKVFDRTTLIGGIRYNHEDRKYLVDYSRFVVPGVPNGGNVLPGHLTASKLLPTAGINFQPSRALMVYGKFSSGYQAPGFNATPGVFSSPSVLRTTNNEFKAENLDAFEAGVKSQFFSNKVTFNASVYHYSYENMQVRTVGEVGIVSIFNAASAKVDGIEADLTVAPLPGLRLSANVAYNDARYSNFCDAIQAGAPAAGNPTHSDTSCSTAASPGKYAQRAGNQLNQAPLWQGGVSAKYQTPFGSGYLHSSISYGWMSNAYFTSANEPLLASGHLRRLDARLSYEFPNEVEIYVFGKNLTDNVVVDSTVRGSPSFAIVHVGDPRVWGMGLRYRF